MKKLRTFRWSALAVLLVVLAAVPACTSYSDDYGYYEDSHVSVGVTVYGGYYGGGWGGCCYGGGGGVYIPSGGPGFGPRPTPY